MSNDVIQLEHQLSDAKKLVEQRDMALKLSNNREFRKLILEGYLIDETVRLAGAAGDPILSPQIRADMLAMAPAPGHLKRYLSIIVQAGNTAENDIAEIEEGLAEARAAEDHPGQVEETDGGLA